MSYTHTNTHAQIHLYINTCYHSEDNSRSMLYKKMSCRCSAHMCSENTLSAGTILISIHPSIYPSICQSIYIYILAHIYCKHARVFWLNFFSGKKTNSNTKFDKDPSVGKAKTCQCAHGESYMYMCIIRTRILHVMVSVYVRCVYTSTRIAHTDATYKCANV
jgi:hypothetical protein